MKKAMIISAVAAVGGAAVALWMMPKTRSYIADMIEEAGDDVKHNAHKMDIKAAVKQNDK